MEAPKQTKIRVTVSFDLTNGQCSVNGPVQLKALCVMALAEGIKTIAMHDEKQTPQPTVLHPVGNGNGGTLPQ